MKQDTVDIFILIDALGWEYIKNKPFLDDIAVTKRPVKSILGFSSGVIPSILTGEYPQSHKHWSLYFYSPSTSPFRWTKGLLWLPKKILSSRLARKIIEEISKKLMGYSGYFETYAIPVKQLHLFDICENRNIYAPQGIRGNDTIFDFLKKNNVDYQVLAYPMKDHEIFLRAKEWIAHCPSRFYFLYFSESDALLHRACRDKAQVDEMVTYYEKEIKDVYKVAQAKFNKVNLFIFSDHGMVAVEKGFDLKNEVERLGFESPRDYVAFYDSTMARFWFFNAQVKEAVTTLLEKKNYGRVLSEEELKALGVKFEKNMYGEVIFLMNMGYVICPSFMSSRVPQGMHGFSVDDGKMDAILVSNQKIDQEIHDVRDFFTLMSNHLICDSHDRIRKSKILYFLNSKVRAGVEEHVLRLIEGLDKSQLEPILACPQQLVDLLKDDLERIGVRYYSVYIRRWHNLKEIGKFLAMLRKEKPDIVHSHLFLATMFAAPLAKLAGVPIVIDTSHLREAWRKGIKKSYFIDRFFYRFVDKIIAVSNAVSMYLIKEKKLNKDKIKVIHNGIDLDRFSNTGSLLKNKRFTIGVIGRLESQKGHKYFLDAVNLLIGKINNVRFVIVGDGSLENQLKEQAQKLGITKMVEFLGYRRDIENIFREIDLLVLPSLFEGLPLVALEALAMAKPVIVTDVDGSPEVVKNKQTGLVVPPRDSVALAEAMSFLANNEEVRIKFGTNGRQFVIQNFDSKQQIKKTEELYQSLLES